MKLMKNALRNHVCLAIGVLCFGLAMPLSATTIFSNTNNDSFIRFNPGLLEVGDQILLASTERYLTNFSFEYWGQNSIHMNSFSGNIQARVQFYLNTGPLFNGYASPSATAFYTSPFFSIPTPTDRSVFNFSSAGGDFAPRGLLIPTPGVVGDSMTWSVQFVGMGAGDSVGLDIFSPPTVGQDYPDYWQNNGFGNWQLMTNSVATTMNFAARLDATVPEPSVLALSIFGGLSLLVVARRLRRLE
jgi:hypothetical protein